MVGNMHEIAAELDRTFGLWKPALSGLQRAADSEIQRCGLMHRFVAVWLPPCERRIVIHQMDNRAFSFSIILGGSAHTFRRWSALCGR